MTRPEYEETAGAKEIFGHDGKKPQFILTDGDGHLQVDINAIVENSQVIGSQSEFIQQREGTLEQTTYDTNLADVLGSVSLKGPTGRIVVDPLPTDIYVTGAISAQLPQFAMDVRGYSSAVIQVGGVWTGTITFEIFTGGSNDWAAILGIPIGTSLPVSTATAVGTWRFNVVGCQRIRVRFSTATTGRPTVTIGASVNPLGMSPNQVIGSLVALSQKATTYEQNTYDTNLATVLGTALLLTTGTWATRQTRLKTEAVGRDLGDPGLRTFDGGWQQAVQDRPLFLMIEQLLTQQKITNNLLVELAISMGCNFGEFEYRDQINQ